MVFLALGLSYSDRDKPYYYNYYKILSANIAMTSSTITTDTGYVWIDSKKIEADLTLMEMQAIHAILSKHLWRRNSDIRMGMIFDDFESKAMEEANKRHLRLNDKSSSTSVEQYMELAGTL